MMKRKICVALDVSTLSEAKDLAKRLSPWVGIFKIGSQLFTSEGPRIVEAIQNAGGEVFLDLKYHDIPNTVMQASIVAAKMGVFMFNIHALGGSRMMRTVAERIVEEADKTSTRKPILLGITILTSMSAEELRSDLRIDIPIDEYVCHLARLAKGAGLDGVVCSPKELAIIRNACGSDFVLVAPGIRPAWVTTNNDQIRITTPRQAITDGADYIVVGRPITHAESPEIAAERILQEIN
jgi:orotidine-5'-phosphate decarboxylase